MPSARKPLPELVAVTHRRRAGCVPHAVDIVDAKNWRDAHGLIMIGALWRTELQRWEGLQLLRWIGRAETRCEALTLFPTPMRTKQCHEFYQPVVTHEAALPK